MLRSMYSGISGMKANQIKLDVIGNNIANVGTTSFKSSRARFSDMLRQNVSDAMAPSSNQGGKNASQVGLGVQLASIDSVMTQGMMQPTGRNLDVAIDGDGFFMVSKGPEVFDNKLNVNHNPGAHTIAQKNGEESSDIMYSRDGSFILDREGNLLTGDGFRVMGYSLTNGDNGETPTSKSPNPVNVGAVGLDVNFGPGSQLNGYKVVLGEIGPGTVASAEVNKNSKQIVVNADFNTYGAVTTEQIATAINKGLSSAGISQTATVTGKPITVNGLGSEEIKGGVNATSPDSVSFAGFTVKFTEGSQLNGYTFKVGKIGGDVKESVDINKASKEIVLNGDLVNGYLSDKDLQTLVNNALKGANIEQEIRVTGSLTSTAMFKGASDSSGADAEQASTELIQVSGAGKTFGGLDLKFSKGAGLNGYTIKFGESKTGTKTDVVFNKKEITIEADLSGGLTPEIKKDIMSKFNSGISKERLGDIKLEGIDGNVVSGDLGNSLLIKDDGKDLKAAKNVSLSGFTISMPKGEAFNDIEFEVVDIKSPTTKVEVDKNNPKKLLISGDFLNEGRVSKDNLESEINKAMKISDTQNKFEVSGSLTTVGSLVSQDIEGGDDYKAPGKVEALNMTFNFGDGAHLNGFKIRIGKVNGDGRPSVDVDQKGKVLTINGDFVTQGATDAQAVQNAINKALKEAGIVQSITVEGKPSTISGTESDLMNGGTPVQSLGADGTLSFVDAGGELKSYDGELKTLRIPDKVTIPGNPPQDLRVKTYSIDKNGIITGVLEDGRVAALGQIAMATFKNPEGLTSMGQNLYTSSVNSGEAIIKSGVGTLGEDNSKGYGDNLQGMLEMSNVDLAEQFTDMIVTTRAFQASGKMINTGDEVLQDIINLKR